jgi:hypothetical protein
MSVMGGKDVAVLPTGGAEVFVAVGCGGRVATVEVMIGTVAEASGKVGIAVDVMTGGRGVGVAGVLPCLMESGEQSTAKSSR